jgi:hypothetical protein
MEMNESSECPLCLEQMQIEDREQQSWLVCPNGCPTDMEIVIPKKPPESADISVPVLRARASGSST